VSNPRALPGGEGAIRASPTARECAARRRWVLSAAVLGSTIAFVDE